MENQLTQITPEMMIAAGIGFLVGAVLFWIIASMTRPSSTTHDTLQKSYDDLKIEHQTYRENVSNHFSKTNDAFDNLNKNYQDLLRHLSTGAETLMDKKSLQQARNKPQGNSITRSDSTAKNNDKNQHGFVDNKVKTDKSTETTTKQSEQISSTETKQYSQKAGKTKSEQEKSAPANTENKKNDKNVAISKAENDTVDPLNAVKRHIRDSK